MIHTQDHHRDPSLILLLAPGTPTWSSMQGSCWCEKCTQRQSHSKPNKAGFTRAENERRASQFSWKLTKDKAVRYQSLELAGWYQTVPYLRLRSQMRWHIAMKSYLPEIHDHSGNRKRGKVTLPNGWRKHDSDRSLFEQRCMCIRPWPIPMKIK
jgi:hypothetical protein